VDACGGGLWVVRSPVRHDMEGRGLDRRHWGKDAEGDMREGLWMHVRVWCDPDEGLFGGPKRKDVAWNVIFPRRPVASSAHQLTFQRGMLELQW
jgi:hypothetical protein